MTVSVSDSEGTHPGSDRDREMTAGRDDFFDTPGMRRLSRWVVVGLGVLTLAVIAVPLIFVFTDWL
jgi:hypothetical protein